MKQTKEIYFPTIEAIKAATLKLKGVAAVSPLEKHQRFSEKYDCQMFFKREDLQQVRSYKIRGAYNKISSLNPNEIKKGIVCASAGNHAQGVALSCNLLKIKYKILLSTKDPPQHFPSSKLQLCNSYSVATTTDDIIPSAFIINIPAFWHSSIVFFFYFKLVF